MGKSVNIVFIKQKKTDNVGTVNVRTIENGNISRKSLGIKVTEKQFEKYFDPESKRFSRNQNFPMGTTLNEKIESFLAEFQRYGSDLKSMPDNKKSFLKYWNDLVKTQRNHGTRIKHETVIAKLEKYLVALKKTDLLFKDITPLFLRELKAYWGTVKDPKQLSDNSVTHYLKIVKSVINQSAKDEHYSFVKNPFDSIGFDKDKIRKRVLSESDIERLIITPIEIPSIDLARNMFLFQVFSNGMRVSDLLLLRWESIQETRLDYVMYKTRTHINIPVNLNMALILSKLLGLYERYQGLLDNYKIPFRNEFGRSPIQFQAINLPELDKIIKDNDYSDPKRDRYRNASGSTVVDIVRKPKEAMGEIITYKGYRVGVNQEYLKRFIDARETLINEIDKTFLGYITRKIAKSKEKADFVFPVLSKALFEGGNKQNKSIELSLEQYKDIKHSTIVYNRRLKKVQEICEIETTLSSHVSRHTFTNLLLRMDNVNLYDISQSLGHSSIKITESYLTTGFNLEKVDYLNNKISKRFSYK